jgi:molybdopterin-guanine dinucleotide biosynthesis protein A
MKPEPAAAIILAGGHSRRMRREKALLRVGGRTLIESLIDQLRPCFPDILVSAGEGNKLVFLGLPVIVDEAPGQGPLPAILTALRASPRQTNFVVACDIPVVRLPFVREILALARDSEIVVPRHDDGKFEPLFAAYDRGIAPVIARQIASGDLRISSLFKTCRTAFVAIDGQAWLRNLNTREEYHDFLKTRTNDAG